MRKEKLIVLEKNSTKNDVGAVVDYFTEKGIIWCDYVLTISEDNQRTYGYDPKSTKQTNTRDSFILENNYVRYKDKIYYVPQVIPYPRHFTVLLEEVNTSDRN